MLACLLYLLLFYLGFSFALPQYKSSSRTGTASDDGLSVPLIRSNHGKNTAEEKVAWLKRQGEFLNARYGFKNSSSNSVVARGSGKWFHSICVSL